MLNKSSSSPVRTGPFKGLNGSTPPPDHGFPPLGLRAIVAAAAGVVVDGPAEGAFELLLVVEVAVIESADGCCVLGREVAAEYDNLENILSNPLFPPALAESGVVVAVAVVDTIGPRLDHSKFPPIVPGLLLPPPGLPTPLKLGLGPILGGGGRAWMREYPAAKPCGRLCPGACDWRARVEGDRAVWGWFRCGLLLVVAVVAVAVALAFGKYVSEG